VADGGSGIRAGVEQRQRERHERGEPPLELNLDVFHIQREAGRLLRQHWQHAEAVWDQAVAREQAVERRRRQGANTSRHHRGRRAAWDQARTALARVARPEQAWPQAAQALAVFTPEGCRNDRRRAEAQIAAALPELADARWAKTRRAWQDPRCLTFLDRLHQHLQHAEPHEALREALVHWWWRRRHRPRAAEGPAAAHLAEPLQALICAPRAPHGPAAYRRVAAALRPAVRASSVVACRTSVTRMHQARPRHWTQALLDLQRLPWNCRLFRAGKRRHRCPYGWLGLRLPTYAWWRLLTMPRRDVAQQPSTP